MELLIIIIYLDFAFKLRPLRSLLSFNSSGGGCGGKGAAGTRVGHFWGFPALRLMTSPDRGFSL